MGFQSKARYYILQCQVTLCQGKKKTSAIIATFTRGVFPTLSRLLVSLHELRVDPPISRQQEDVSEAYGVRLDICHTWLGWRCEVLMMPCVSDLPWCGDVPTMKTESSSKQAAGRKPRVTFGCQCIAYRDRMKLGAISDFPSVYPCCCET